MATVVVVLLCMWLCHDAQSWRALKPVILQHFESTQAKAAAGSSANNWVPSPHHWVQLKRQLDPVIVQGYSVSSIDGGWHIVLFGTSAGASATVAKLANAPEYAQRTAGQGQAFTYSAGTVDKPVVVTFPRRLPLF